MVSNDTKQKTPTRILRIAKVTARVDLSRTSVWRLCRARKFPQPIRLSDRAIGWIESEVDEWIAGRERA